MPGATSGSSAIWPAASVPLVDPVGPAAHPNRRSRPALSWIVFVVAVAGMLVIYRDLWADPGGSSLGTISSQDPMQTMWFLSWTPHQLLHGHSPFTTDAIFYPEGVSLAWNTLIPTLGVLVAPLTLTVGAPLTFSILITLGPALTAVTGFWWLRRHVRHPAPAAAGALLLAFDPYMGGHLLGHLNLTFVALLPLMLMLGEDLLWRHPRPQRRTAVYLGLATAAQLGISEELALITVVGFILVLLFALGVMPRRVWPIVRACWPWSALALGVSLVAASPLLISQLFLSPSVTVAGDRFHAVPLDYVAGSGRLLLAPVVGRHTFLGLAVAEDAVYLGWAMLAVLVIGTAITIHRDRLVRIAAGALLVTVLLTFGSNGLGDLWLPWRALGRLPALESVLPVRFAFASLLIISWLVARWSDKLLAVMQRPVVATGPTDGPDIATQHTAATQRASPTRVTTPMRRLAAGVGMVAILAALLSLLPTPVSSSPLPAPVAFFGSAQQRALLPEGAPVLLLAADDTRAMFYQQEAGFDFRQSGGYALRPPRDASPNLPGRILVKLGDDAQRARWSTPSAAALAVGRSALCELGLHAIIVVSSAAQAQRLIDLAAALTGHRPDVVAGGVSFWMLTPGQC